MKWNINSRVYSYSENPIVFSWYSSQKEILLDQTVFRSVTELAYVKRTVQIEGMSTENKWIFEFSRQE